MSEEDDMIVQIAELERVRSDYARWAKEMDPTERFALGVVGGIWTWCATTLGTAPAPVALVIWVPFLIVVLLSWRVRSSAEDMKEATRYMIKLEAKIGGGLAWQRYLVRNSSGLRVGTAYLFWWSLVLVTMFVAVVVTVHAYAAPNPVRWGLALGGLGTLAIVGLHMVSRALAAYFKAKGPKASDVPPM